MDKDYLKLLKYQNRLKAEGKNLAKENEKKFINLIKNLIKYEIRLLDHFKWEQNHPYFLLIRNFLDKKIDLYEYMEKLLKLEDETQTLVEELKLDFKKLKDFEPNSVSEGFSKFIEQLYSDCRQFEPDPDLRDELELSETQLRNGAENILSQIQKY